MENITLNELLEIYLMELKIGIVDSWESFQRQHMNKLRYIENYAQGMKIVNLKLI